MATITIMLSVMFLYLMLLSSAYGEDHWKEQIRDRLVRTSRRDSSFWESFFWRRTTTQRTPTIASATTKLTTLITSKITAQATANVTAKVTTANPSSLFTTFQIVARDQTNKYRAAHCAANLLLNSTLNSIAQTYANKLVLIGSLVHSNNGYGENLYYTGSSQAMDINSIKGSIPVDSWYSEVNQYNWTSSDFSSSTGHFTQLVWKATEQFGIGIACTNNQKACYIVANYSPSGNFGKQYQNNVKRQPCT